METSGRDPSLHQRYFTLQLCTSEAVVAAAVIRTNGEGAWGANKCNQENDDGGERKKLRFQVENLTRALNKKPRPIKAPLQISPIPRLWPFPQGGKARGKERERAEEEVIKMRRKRKLGRISNAERSSIALLPVQADRKV